jgi:hypothetical protein
VLTLKQLISTGGSSARVTNKLKWLLQYTKGTITRAIAIPLKKADFQQSTFYSAALNIKQLQKRVPDFQPALSEDGQIDQYVLSKMDGRTSLENIARQVYRRFPSRFRTQQASLSHVCNLSQQFGR